MAKVFISYSSKNRDLVKALAADIEELGHDVWFDKELTGAHIWWEAILEAIRACEVFIFALSPEALSSEPCSREYKYAHELGKTILPVLVHGTIESQTIPEELTIIQFVDYRKQQKETALRLARAFANLPASQPLPEILPKPPDVPISAHTVKNNPNPFIPNLPLVALNVAVWTFSLYMLRTMSFYYIDTLSYQESLEIPFLLILVVVPWLIQGLLIGLLLNNAEEKDLQWYLRSMFWGGALAVFHVSYKYGRLKKALYIVWFFVVTLLVLLFSMSNEPIRAFFYQQLNMAEKPRFEFASALSYVYVGSLFGLITGYLLSVYNSLGKRAIS